MHPTQKFQQGIKTVDDDDDDDNGDDDDDVDDDDEDRTGYKYQPLWPLLAASFSSPFLSISLSRPRAEILFPIMSLSFSRSVLLDVLPRHLPSPLLHLLSFSRSLARSHGTSFFYPPRRSVSLSLLVCLFLARSFARSVFLSFFLVLLTSVWLMPVRLYSTICI